MIFSHEKYTKKDGDFIIDNNISAIANRVFDKPIFVEFWEGFTRKASNLKLTYTDALVFSIGNAKTLSLDEFDYTINVECGGISISAKDEKNLIYAFMTLLDCIYIDSISAKQKIACCEIRECPDISQRMVHFCLFPDTELWELKRFVRLCGALKYTHLILEFWGMYKFDCLAELSWKHAFTKEQIKPIIQEANDMGLEIIPMLNHWGHASQSRVIHGKHVVLDQNPRLYRLFNDDGWCWNIESEEVRKLLSCMRSELIELCGDGEYFHIGCDEAYNFEHTTANMDRVCEYINEVSDSLSNLGRRTIMWGDMVVSNHDTYMQSYNALCPDEEAEAYMMATLNKNIVIADWQYCSESIPIETSLALNDAGFDVLVCPCDAGTKYSDACIGTVKNHNLHGLLHTTWHTLSVGMPYVVRTAAATWNCDIPHYADMSPYAVKTASLIRKVCPSDGSYEKAGWAKYEIGVIV